MTSPREQSRPQNPLKVSSRKREATRQRLVTVAFSLFHERGFDTVTIDEITSAAGVSRRTFFRYFECKEAVVFPFNIDRMGRFRMALHARTGGRPAEMDDLKAVFVGLAQEFMDNAEEMHMRRRIVENSDALVRFEHTVNLEWQRAIADGIDGKLLACVDSDAPSYSAQVAAGAIIGALIPSFTAWYDGDTKGDLRALGLEALSVVEGGTGRTFLSLNLGDGAGTHKKAG